MTSDNEEIIVSDLSADNSSVIFDSSYDTPNTSISVNKVLQSPEVTLCNLKSANNNLRHETELENYSFPIFNKSHFRGINASSTQFVEPPQSCIILESDSDSDNESGIFQSPSHVSNNNSYSLYSTPFNKAIIDLLIDTPKKKVESHFASANLDSSFTKCPVTGNFENISVCQDSYSKKNLNNSSCKIDAEISLEESFSAISLSSDVPNTIHPSHLSFPLKEEITKTDKVKFGLKIPWDACNERIKNYALPQDNESRMPNSYKTSSSLSTFKSNNNVSENKKISDIILEYKKSNALDLSSLSMAISTNKNAEIKKKPKVNNYGGKLSEHNEQRMIRLTSDAVESFHSTLKSMPNVDVFEEKDPEGLKVKLLPHQKKALAWLLWRESQVPQGGILADDMGLGKTLTMLSLILRHTEISQNNENKDSQSQLKDEEVIYFDERNSFFKKKSNSLLKSQIICSSGTLVVCPASLLGQWENEVKRHIFKNKLSVFVYHGNNRDISLTRLSTYNVVVTTYQQVMKEAFAPMRTSSKENFLMEENVLNQGPLFHMFWARIILDEAHQIRNYQSKTSQSTCMLRSKRRWAITGTPVQNKDMDFFALIRFIRVSPFDDYTCWRHEIKTSTAQGLRKLNLLVRALVLRRTKNQIDVNTGEQIVDLPPKEIIVHEVCLSQNEREVYDRIFAFSRKSLIEYMKTPEQKELEKASNVFVRGLNEPQDKYTPTLEINMFKGKEVKVHHMLVLLLRLRQICGHPGLIESCLNEEKDVAEPIKLEEFDLVEEMEQLNLQSNKFDAAVRENILCTSNPVFQKDSISSKIERIVEEIKSLEKKGEKEKAVIVSQWTSMLSIISEHLKKIRINSVAITGQIPIKDRASIVENFNITEKGPKVLLLSLAAGGVGLNLTGANHLFLCDMHWNPQLEAQACDRIYRVGQTRPVKIHKFVVLNSVEVKILELQQKKIELANMVLTGTKISHSSKLTLQDLKALFNVI